MFDNVAAINNGIWECVSMLCLLALINIVVQHRQISLTCLLPTHPHTSQPRYDTDDTDLRGSVWKEAHVTSEYLTIFDTFECWDFLLMASIEQILNEYKYFGNVSRGSGWWHRVYCTGDTYTEYDKESLKRRWLLHRRPNFMSTYHGVNAHLAYCVNIVLNVKAVVAAFNQEKALIGTFSVITNLRMDLLLSFQALSLHSAVILSSCVHPWQCHAGNWGPGSTLTLLSDQTHQKSIHKRIYTSPFPRMCETCTLVKVRTHTWSIDHQDYEDYL